MNGALITIVVLLLAGAIGVQVAYLRALTRAGVEITRMTLMVSYFNMGLLALIAVGLVVLFAYGPELLKGFE